MQYKYRAKSIGANAYKADGKGKYPDWMQKLIDEEWCIAVQKGKSILVCTLSGDQTADIGDYIVQDELGIMHVYSEDEFKAYYEACEAT